MTAMVSKPQRDMAPMSAPAAFAAPELSVVIPTYKERANVAPLLEKLDTVLAGIAWEAIFVDDDSPDGTATAAKEIARTDPRVRCLRRVNRRGLAGACIEGMLFSSAPYVAVIDGDMQHDESLLPRMLKKLKAGDTDLAVGSRYSDRGNADVVVGVREGFLERLLGAVIVVEGIVVTIEAVIQVAKSNVKDGQVGRVARE